MSTKVKFGRANYTPFIRQWNWKECEQSCLKSRMLRGGVIYERMQYFIYASSIPLRLFGGTEIAAGKNIRRRNWICGMLCDLHIARKHYFCTTAQIGNCTRDIFWGWLFSSASKVNLRLGQKYGYYEKRCDFQSIFVWSSLYVFILVFNLQKQWRHAKLFLCFLLGYL